MEMNMEMGTNMNCRDHESVLSYWLFKQSNSYDVASQSVVNQIFYNIMMCIHRGELMSIINNLNQNCSSNWVSVPKHYLAGMYELICIET